MNAYIIWVCGCGCSGARSPERAKIIAPGHAQQSHIASLRITSNHISVATRRTARARARACARTHAHTHTRADLGHFKKSYPVRWVWRQRVPGNAGGYCPHSQVCIDMQVDIRSDMRKDVCMDRRVRCTCPCKPMHKRQGVCLYNYLHWSQNRLRSDEHRYKVVPEHHFMEHIFMDT